VGRLSNDSAMYLGKSRGGMEGLELFSSQGEEAYHEPNTEADYWELQYELPFH